MSLGRGVDLVDGPGGSETAGGVAADAHGDFVALAGLRVVQREACAVACGFDGAAFAGDPVVLADDAECVGAVGEIGRQLVQERAGAEDFGCEIDGEVLGDGGRYGCGGRYHRRCEGLLIDGRHLDDGRGFGAEY